MRSSEVIVIRMSEQEEEENVGEIIKTTLTSRSACDCILTTF